MEVKLNQNIHLVKGEKDIEGYYVTPCPHNAKFEYINGWGVRMVGSACCGACPFNVKKQRYSGRFPASFNVSCYHTEGEEKNSFKLSVIKTKC